MVILLFLMTWALLDLMADADREFEFLAPSG